MWKIVTLSVCLLVLFQVEHGTSSSLKKGEREDVKGVASPVKKLIHTPETPDNIPSQPTNSPKCSVESASVSCEDGEKGYYYNSELGTCQKGGCPGNDNYFKTAEECGRACACHVDRGCYGCKPGTLMNFYYADVDCYYCVCDE